jgi:hypothetical protein
MSAPCSSFCSELTAYQQWFLANRQQFTDREYELGLQVLGRWQHRDPDEIEAIWNMISSKAAIDPQQFIGIVVWRRAEAETHKTILHLEPKIRAKILARRNFHADNRDYSSLKDENELWLTFKNSRERIFSRDAKTAHRVVFERSWRDKFKELCGRPLDEAVAFLTQVAFDIKDVTAEAVRSTGKSPRIRKRR